ncbi:MAG: SDR family NAD(P)-dependent oxidoreductase, partial [Granulosicoccus sp.]|nr:SDR family NAD(P)-dependent oxidoreductase [Granulosicoccus sp.]
TNGIDPSSVDYVECHGTGTGIGDPTECTAIGSTYGAGRQDNPVVIGSIKSNIGHTEAVAGVAGIIKASLNCMHRTATPLGNLQTPREDIDFENLGIRLSDDLIPLGKKDKPVTAAVNSFGYGGSNAHVILQSSSMDLSTDSEDSAKIVDTEKAEHEVPYALPVSGRSKDALIANAARLAEWMENTEKPLDDIIYSASMRRAHFNFRSVAMGRNRKELISALQDIAQDQENDLIVHDAQPIQGQRQPVYVFTGMGPQWWYMGQELYANQRIYREYAHLADAAFAKVAGFSILSEMLKPEDSSQIQKTIYAQPANLIIQIGVFEMLKAQGLQPGMIVGHSVGELGSAYAAGVLSLEDAMLVSFHRSQLQAETAGLGGMLAIGKSKADAQRYIEPYSELVSFAAINGPTSVTLAGCVDTLKLIEEQLTSEGVFAKALDVEIPYHSPMMQPLMERLEQALLSIEPKIPSIPLYSTVTGEQVTDVSFGADYWPLNIRQPVEFEAAIMSIMDSGYNTFVEIGPHPVLSASLRDCAKLAGKDCRLIHTLRRNLPNESRNIHRAMMSVFTAGCDFNWAPFLASETFVQLPNYQWQREHYWIENNRAMQDRVNPIVHPILGTQEALASAVWRNDFDHHSLHYLRDHVVSSLPILPAAGYLESLLELAAIQFPDDAGLTLRDVEISAPLILTPDAGIDFTTSYDPVSQATLIRSQENGRLGTAQVHVTSRIGAVRHAAEAKVDFIRQSADQSDDVIQFYKKLDQNGLSYGPMFQTVQELHVQREKGAVVARLALNSALLENLDKYKLHPTLLDGCFQTLLALLSDEETTYLPTNIGELCYYGQSSPAELWCIGELTQKTERELTCSLSLVDQEGNLIVSIRDFIATAASKPERVDKWGEKVRLEILNYQWDYGESLGEPKRLGHWLAVGDGGDFATAVSERIQGLGAKVVANVNYGESYAQSDRDFTVAFDSVNDAREVLSATGELSGIVFYVAMDNTLRHDSPTAEKSINALLVFTQALLELPAEKRPRVYVATQSAFIVNEDDEAVDPGCSAVNGYVRVAFNELEDFHFTSIDLPDDLDDEETLDAFVFELLCDAEEDEIAIRDESRMVTELLEDKVLTEDVILPTQLDDEHPIAIRPLRAETDSVGMVRVLSSSKATPTQNDIHIRVEASLLPKNLLENQKSTEIGQAWVEIVGEIIDVGSNVQDLQKGDRVCGFAPADLSSHLCGDRNSFHLVRIPKDADAALLVGGISLPVCAHHAVAAQHIESGDTALVQYSPMGMAVASVLAARGVKVTLLSDTPDDLDESIRNLYPVYLASPANIERAIAEQTDGNNFSGMVVMLSEWGREYDFRSLVEGGWIINTSDLNTAVQLTGSIGSVSRTALGAALNKPSRFATILQDVVGDIIEGQVESDPTLDVSIVDITWQNLALPEMTTRIVIDYETGGKDLPMVQPDQLAFAQNATYLITGGLGGFGHKTAEWLIDNGAKHLVLTGRSGASKPAAKAILEHLQSLGATVTAAACDTSDIESLSALFDEIAETMPPLKGIFHCGAVIADQAISDADLETVNSVMRSKATGAYNLHVLSKNIELDHFILYSSIANQIGNGRQCAYSAANGYLNGLAHMRALQGLPGTAINWGAIDDVGVVAEDEKIELFFKAVGVRAIPVMEALDILRLGMSRQTTQFGAMLAQWA